MTGTQGIAPPRGVPPGVRFAIFGDSGNRVFRRSGTVDVHAVIQRHHFMFADATIRGCSMTGADCGDIVKMMKNDDMLMGGGYDAVTVVCFLNGALDNSMNYNGEPVNLMEQFMEMCQVLRQHTFRPFLVLGGSADLWKMDDKWNFFGCEVPHASPRVWDPRL